MEIIQNSNKLKTIRTLTVAQSNTYSGWFSGCGALENITFSGEIGNNISFADSPNLSSESVTSIIDALATVTEARTLTLNASVSLTDEQKSIIEEKGWDLVQ